MPCAHGPSHVNFELRKSHSKGNYGTKPNCNLTQAITNSLIMVAKDKGASFV